MDDGSGKGAIWPQPKFYFSVDIEGIGTGLSFQEVTGLESETQVIEYRSGDSKAFSTIKMPGIVKTGNVTLKNGVVVKDDKLWKWLAALKTNRIEQRTITIKLLDQDAKPTMVWTLANAWPTKVTSIDLKADGNEIAIGTLDLAHEGITIENA